MNKNLVRALCVVGSAIVGFVVGYDYFDEKEFGVRVVSSLFVAAFPGGVMTLVLCTPDPKPSPLDEYLASDEAVSDTPDPGGILYGRKR